MRPNIRRIVRTLALAMLVLASLATPARADAMLFMGLTTGTAVPAFGVTWGKWSAPIGFEVELSGSPGAASSGHSGSASFGGNLLVDTPVRIHRARLYGSAGLGLFGTRNGTGKEIGGPAKNVGGGVRIPIAAGVLLRVDYRAFFVESGNGDYKPGHAQRLATGISFTF